MACAVYSNLEIWRQCASSHTTNNIVKAEVWKGIWPHLVSLWLCWVKKKKHTWQLIFRSFQFALQKTEVMIPAIWRQPFLYYIYHNYHIYGIRIYIIYTSYIHRPIGHGPHFQDHTTSDSCSLRSFWAGCSFHRFLGKNLRTTLQAPSFYGFNMFQRDMSGFES